MTETPLRKGSNDSISSTGSEGSEIAEVESRSRRSTESTEPSKYSESPPATDTSGNRLSRKRTSEQINRRLDQGKEEEVAGRKMKLPSHLRFHPNGSPISQVCLCQPDPKIPRPRNAFILYRQSHQGDLTANNPSLSNPDISKIMGEKWREEPIEVKNGWKALAEAEKYHHQKKYPGYRYQPKRLNSKNSGTSSTTSNGRCQKCGGRSMPSPVTPASISSPSPSIPLPSPAPTSTTTMNADGSTRSMALMSLASPHVLRRGSRPCHPTSVGAVHVQKQAESDGRALDNSPEANKRRRFTSTGSFVPTAARPHPGTPHPMFSDFYNPFPTRASGWTQHDAKTMGPPPLPPTYPQNPQPVHQAHHTHQAHQIQQIQQTQQTHPPAHMGHHQPIRQDLSLTLPPIKTSGCPGHHRKIVETVVMSMPCLGKIKVLGRISPPLEEPESGNSPYKTRGVVVAVEGDNPHTTNEVVAWLQDFLGKDEECYVRAADGPVGPDENEKASLREFHALIAEWRSKGEEMIEFITSNPIAASTYSSPKLSDDSTAETTAATGSNEDTEINDAADQGSEHGSSAATPTRASPVAKIPIILLRGYQLAASNSFASRIPIQDAYSPTDHWQWMATMWRGIIGADITIYIKDGDALTPSTDAATAHPSAAGPTGLGILRDGVKEKDKGVEIREEARCIIVRREGGKVEEKTLRRLGFEIGEWIRLVGYAKSGEGVEAGLEGISE